MAFDLQGRGLSRWWYWSPPDCSLIARCWLLVGRPSGGLGESVGPRGASAGHRLRRSGGESGVRLRARVRSQSPSPSRGQSKSRSPSRLRVRLRVRRIHIWVGRAWPRGLSRSSERGRTHSARVRQSHLTQETRRATTLTYARPRRLQPAVWAVASFRIRKLKDSGEFCNITDANAVPSIRT